MTDEQIAEHDRVFQEAAGIVKDEILLQKRSDISAPDWFLRRKLNRALSLFERVIHLNPENWSAMWLSGKVCQRLNDPDTALSWFERAYQINPSRPDVAREASICAMDSGRHDAAITFAHRAVQIEPTNPGLHANLALSSLLAARIPDAQASIDSALSGDPKDNISQTIAAMIRHFTSKGSKPPTTAPVLLAYWAKNRNA